MASPRCRKLSDAGAKPQRLLWASTGTKNPGSPETLYPEALAAPNTINTLPEKTLLALAENGVTPNVLSRDGGNVETVIAEFVRVGVDDALMANQLQREGVQSFTDSWCDLMTCITTKSTILVQ